MTDDALSIFEEQAEWMKDRLVYGTTAYLAEHFDTFPMPGMGLSFVRSSAESVLTDRVEERLVPRLNDHLATQIDLTRALIDDGEPDGTVEEFREDLLATDPLWDVLNGSDAVQAEAREDIIAANVEACSRAAEWVEAAGDRAFADYTDLVVSLDKTPEEAAEELDRILYYVELLEEYQEHIDASDYSSVLDSDRVHDWFLEHFIEGLRVSQDEILAEVRQEIADAA